MKTIKLSELKRKLEKHEEFYNTDGESGELMDNLEDHVFTNIILTGVNFFGLSLKNTKFIKCRLIAVNFMGTNLENVDFTGSRLHHSIFKDANLQDTNFTGTYIGGAVFDETDFKNATFKGTTFLENISKSRKKETWISVKVNNVKFSEAQQISNDFLKYIKSKNTNMIPEIAKEMESFYTEYKGKKTAFIVMQFLRTPAHDKIAATIKETLKKHNIIGLRADDKEYSDDLFNNIKTYMHCCDFGISVFERIEEDNFNPNVSIEAGYMMGLRKDVCLLKDKTLRGLPTDFVGKLYKQFDTQNIETTLPGQLEKWMEDKGII
jgi:hypothetical protein